MKKKEIRDLREKKAEALANLVSKKKLELGQAVAKSKAGSEKNLKKGAHLRRDIAQILTVIREKEIAQKEEKKV